MKNLSLALFLALFASHMHASPRELIQLSPATSLDSMIGPIALDENKSLTFEDGSSLGLSFQGIDNLIGDETLYSLQGMNALDEAIQDTMCHGQATHLVVEKQRTYPTYQDTYSFSFIHSETPLGPEDIWDATFCKMYVFQIGNPTITEAERNSFLGLKKIEEISPGTISDKITDPVPMIEQMEKRVDEFKGTTFYQHPLARNTFLRPSISAYIGTKDDFVWGRMKLNYFAEDWLFIHSVFLNADGQIYEFATDREWNREVLDGSIFEDNDSPLNIANLEALQALVSSREAVIRFQGKHYHHDMTVIEKDRQIIRDILELKTELTAQKMQ